MQQTVELLKQLFPGHGKSYYEVISKGLKTLITEGKIEGQRLKIGMIHPTDSNHWNTVFETRENYYKEICTVWQFFAMVKIKNELKKANNFDQYLKAYMDSQFGIFLANTKIIVCQHPDLADDWKACYNAWINENASIIHPYTGLSRKLTKQGVRLIVNEVILKPDLYHQFPEEFKHLVKRQYQLLLTEQNS